LNFSRKALPPVLFLIKTSAFLPNRQKANPEFQAPSAGIILASYDSARTENPEEPLLYGASLKGVKKMENTAAKQEQEKKKGFGAKFMNFLMYGGFIIILIGVVAIVVIVEMLTK
jgi:hypothetical protein